MCVCIAQLPFRREYIKVTIHVRQSTLNMANWISAHKRKGRSEMPLLRQFRPNGSSCALEPFNVTFSIFQDFVFTYLFEFATRTDSPQQHMPITAGSVA